MKSGVTLTKVCTDLRWRIVSVYHAKCINEFGIIIKICQMLTFRRVLYLLSRRDDKINFEHHNVRFCYTGDFFLAYTLFAKSRSCSFVPHNNNLPFWQHPMWAISYYHHRWMLTSFVKRAKKVVRAVDWSCYCEEEVNFRKEKLYQSSKKN